MGRATAKCVVAGLAGFGSVLCVTRFLPSKVKSKSGPHLALPSPGFVGNVAARYGTNLTFQLGGDRPNVLY